MPELLAPVGSEESLKMAVLNGADAVYMGGPMFNARAGAQNFSLAQLEAAAEYCHVRGVKAYLTLNTLLHDDELEKAYQLACEAAQRGMDAVIVQDMGLAWLLAQHTNIPLHASTQMSLHSVEGIKALEKLRFSRVVLARETPIEDIADIHSKVNMEIEAFVHGALCVSFSGQCLFSSMTGGRSGNRGCCAQICRLPFSLYREECLLADGYLLSPKDLCTVDYLKQLLDSGVYSLKIEGRLKRPEYVGVVTGVYRRVLDLLESGEAFDSAAMRSELMAIFNRGGFTKGYYLGEKQVIYPERPNHCGVKVGRVLSEDGREAEFSKRIFAGDGVELRKDGKGIGGGAVYSIRSQGKNVKDALGRAQINALAAHAKQAEIYRTTDSEQLKRVRQTLNRETGRVKLEMEFSLKDGEALLRARDKEKNEALVQRTFLPQSGNTRAEDIRKNLAKLGGTPFSAQTVTVQAEAGVFFSTSQINEMRRAAVEELLQKRADAGKGRFVCRPYAFLRPKHSGKNAEKSIEVRNEQELRRAIAQGEGLVYFRPYDQSSAALHRYAALLEGKGAAQVWFAPFPIRFAADQKELETEQLKKYDGILAGDAGAIYMARELGLPCRGDFQLNVFNCASAAFFTEVLGLQSVSLSQELTEKETAQIAQAAPSEVLFKGRAALMHLVHCPGRTAEGAGACAHCTGRLYLEDRQQYRFPVTAFKMADCKQIVWNSRCTDLKKYTQKLESMKVCLRIVAQEQNETAVTTGHFCRGV